jgi:hypothetical protein
VPKRVFPLAKLNEKSPFEISPVATLTQLLPVEANAPRLEVPVESGKKVRRCCPTSSDVRSGGRVIKVLAAASESYGVGSCDRSRAQTQYNKG